MEVIATLQLINTLTSLATTAAATAEDASHAWDLIKGVASGEKEIDEIEAEIDALEQRGLRPVAPPED